MLHVIFMRWGDGVLEWEIVENTRDIFKVKIKDVDTVFGKQTLLFTIEPHPELEMLVISKSLDGKPYGSETLKVAEFSKELARKHWVRFKEKREQ